jgi:hypothetical protein
MAKMKKPPKCPECGSPMTRGYTSDYENFPSGVFYMCEPCSVFCAAKEEIKGNLKTEGASNGKDEPLADKQSLRTKNY